MKRATCLLLCLILITGLLANQITAAEPDLLKSTGDQFVKDNGLTEEDFAVYFYNTETREEYVYNENAFFPVGNAWILPLHMHYNEHEKLGDYNPPRDRPADIYTINGLTLEECRTQSIVLNNTEVSRQMRDNLGTSDQYLTLINEEYGHIDPDTLPDSYFRSNCYSVTFLMNCLKRITNHPNLYDDITWKFQGVQTDDGLAGYSRASNITHVRGEENGFVCDMAEVVGANTYLLVCFASEEVGGDELLAKVNELFYKYVEEENGLLQSTEESNDERARKNSTCHVDSLGSEDKSDLYKLIGIFLGGAAVVAAIIALVIHLIRKREDREYEERKQEEHLREQRRIEERQRPKKEE